MTKDYPTLEQRIFCLIKLMTKKFPTLEQRTFCLIKVMTKDIPTLYKELTKQRNFQIDNKGYSNTTTKNFLLTQIDDKGYFHTVTKNFLNKENKENFKLMTKNIPIL